MAGLSLSDPQAWLHAVLDLLPFSFLLVEPGSGRVLFANQAARSGPLESLASGGDDPGATSYVTDPEGTPIPAEQRPRLRAARGERLDGVQVIWHTPRGQASYMVYSGTVPAMHGNPPLAVLTFLEVTQLKATEAELRAAVQARDDFFSVATHELKDPLSSLLLSVGLLKRTAEKLGVVPANTLLQQLDVCNRQGERLTWMIENLLDVSRLASRQSHIHVEAFDLSELAREVAGRFREQARSAGSPLVVETPGPSIGYWDRMQIEHMVSNLLSNALKYGAGGPVTVRVGSDRSAARLDVEDRGIGIAATDHGRIFERFERATGEHRGQSLGLGLYIVRSVVEAHGGTVGVRSAPGQGSTFTVELPRKRLPPRDAPGREDEKPG